MKKIQVTRFYDTFEYFNRNYFVLGLFEKSQQIGSFSCPNYLRG